MKERAWLGKGQGKRGKEQGKREEGQTIKSTVKPGGQEVLQVRPLDVVFFHFAVQCGAGNFKLPGGLLEVPFLFSKDLVNQGRLRFGKRAVSQLEGNPLICRFYSVVIGHNMKPL